jgi:tetratricopeptide (TPR) repeat protein
MTPAAVPPVVSSPQDLSRFLVDMWDGPPSQAVEPDAYLVALAARGGEPAARLKESLETLLTDYWQDDPWGHRAGRGWRRLFRVVSASPAMSSIGVLLARHFSSSQSRLLPLAAGPAADPWLEFLIACGNHQADRTLLPGWLALCELPSGAGIRHGTAAVVGVAAMPDALTEGDSPVPKGEDEAEALVRFAGALARRVEGTRLHAIVAADQFSAAAEVVLRRATPAVVGDKINAQYDQLPPIARRWFSSAGIPVGVSRVAAIRRPDFSAEANELLAEARPRTVGKVDTRIQELLVREREYAGLSGDTVPIVLSLTRFARHFERSDPGYAVRLANEAVVWQPLDPYTWVALVRANRAFNNAESAIDAGFRAVRRFPGLTAPWTELGLSLRDSARFVRAEQVLRVASNRFPEDERLCDLFAYTLRVQRRLQEAENAYRLALRLSDDRNQHSWDGLIVVLALQDRVDEGREAASEAAQLFPDNPRFTARLDQLNSGKIDEPDYEEAPAVEGKASIEGRFQELRLVRHAAVLSGRADDKEAVTQLLVQIDDTATRYRPRLLLERALRDLNEGRLHDAATLLESALRTYPNEVSLLHAEATRRRGAAVEAGASFSDPEYRWLTEPIDRIENSNPGLGALAEWGRLLAFAATTNGDSWDAARVPALSRFSDRLVVSSVSPAVSDDAFVRLWTSRVQSRGSAILSQTFDRAEALATTEEFSVLDEEYALLGSAI